MEQDLTVVLLIDSDAANIQVAKESFGPQQSGFRLELADSLAAGLQRIDQGGVDIVLLNLHLPDADGVEQIGLTVARAKGIPIIVLGTSDDPDLALRIVRAGAHDYLVKGRMAGPSLVRCVRHAVERHRHAEQLLSDGRRRGSKVVTFLGAKGGVGTTTTLLNVAAALAKQGRDVIAIELNTSSSFAAMLKTPRASDIGPLLNLEPERIDRRTVEQKLYSLSFGFRALFGPTKVAGIAAVQPAAAQRLIETARALAEVVLVDLPAQVLSLHQGAIEASDYVALVQEPDPLCVEFAKSFVEMLEEWGVHGAACGLVVVNRSALTNSLRPQEVGSRVGCEVAGVVPAAGEACLVAFGAGKPLFVAQPESRFSLAIKDLAERLVGARIRAVES